MSPGRGREFHLEAIAALAGWSRTTVKDALKVARQGLLLVKERRITRPKSLTNVVGAISPEWKGWLRLGMIGGGNLTSAVDPNKQEGDRESYTRKHGRDGVKTADVAKLGSRSFAPEPPHQIHQRPETGFRIAGRPSRRQSGLPKTGMARPVGLPGRSCGSSKCRNNRRQGAVSGRKKHKNGREKQESRQPFRHMLSASAVRPLRA